MALSDANVVDGLAVDGDGTLVMLISDGMGWEDEGEHLRLLGEKINGYAVFVSSGQWRGAVGADAARVTSFRIELKMAEPFGPRCSRLLSSATRQLQESVSPPIALAVEGPMAELPVEDRGDETAGSLGDALHLDGLAIDGDGTLRMLLEDDMGWGDEERHLGLLADKIGAYAGFVSSGQWREAVGDSAGRVTSFRIELRMAEPFGRRCDELLDSAARQIGALDPPVSLSVSAPGL